LSNNNNVVVVIGSGPAGIAASKALLSQGVDVTMLDVGARMPEDAQSLHDKFAARPPAQWSEQERIQLRQASLRDTGGVPLKTVFGSDFPYSVQNLEESDAFIRGSHAQGGLSNAWGASILPLSARDMADWPLTVEDLEPHYTAILKWLPHAQGPDELSETYPLYSPLQQQLNLSRQGQNMLSRLHNHASNLRHQGITFGQSRLAISQCEYCGLCLQGCPYDYIYNAQKTLDELCNHPAFTYRGDTRVTSIEEHADHVSLSTVSAGVTNSVKAKRVFVGAGVLHTALLLLPLLGRNKLSIRDSAYSLIPFMSYRRTAGISDDALYTLPQLFMEMDIPDISEHNVHMQWYSYNNFYELELRKKLGVAGRILPSVLSRQIVERMWSIQTFLHSDDSPELLLTLAQGGQAALSAVANPAAEKLFAATARHLNDMSNSLGGRVFPALGRKGIPGGSFHSGASVPMSRNPATMQSDLAGRPHGLQRVHIVDASVLPTIASSTITLSVMANAHRIASGYHHYN